MISKTIKIINKSVKDNIDIKQIIEIMYFHDKDKINEILNKL